MKNTFVPGITLCETNRSHAKYKLKTVVSKFSFIVEFLIFRDSEVTIVCVMDQNNNK